MGVEQIGDVLEALDEMLERNATNDERLKAVVHYAEHDSFIEPHQL